MNLVENTQDLQQKLDREVLLRRITKRIRQSLELQEILNCTVQEVRSFLGMDRVMIYQFSPDGSGEVVAEAIHNNRLPSLQGLNFPADDIPVEARQMYVKFRQRTIVDVRTSLIGLSPLEASDSEEHLAKENIYYRALDPCHAAYLTAMGVQSSLVVPILYPNNGPEVEGSSFAYASLPTLQAPLELWGLLVAHNSETQGILDTDLEMVQLVVDQVSIAIAHSNLLTQTRQQAFREATINRVAILLHEQPTIQLQEALEATVSALQAVGGRLYILPPGKQNAQLLTCGEQPTPLNWEQTNYLEEHPLWQQWLQKSLEEGMKKLQDRSPLPTTPAQPNHFVTHNSHFPLWLITDLYKEPQFRVLIPYFQPTGIRGLMVLPLRYRQQLLGCLTVFRKEIDTERLWAGRFDPNAKQVMPRQSFTVWREYKKGQSHPWTLHDIEQAKSLGHHFSMAIQQYVLYKQVQTLNANLEHQVEERTNQLQQSLEFAKVLGRVTDQIRSTLSLKTTLQTIVREVRTLLNTDRAVIYQFTKERQGEVVVEDVRGQWQSILGFKAPESCFPEASACLYRQGRVRAIHNIYEEDLSFCHREFLEKLEVQANVIVPIGTDAQLWGLLIVHECRGPRIWQTFETELLQQLAHQAAIAIQQAELYEASRAAATAEQAKAEQLAKTLGELRHTQAQLIQTEKMSGLGQLVAGVAHEINNPVNFIYGNLSHVSEYSRDLLDLVELYQLHYPNPVLEIINHAQAIDLEFLASDMPKILDSMKIGAERIRQLVLSLRNFSRVDQADKKPVDIHEGLESTLLILQHRLKAKPNAQTIEVIKEYGTLPLVECYASLLNQVFMNLLSNAIDALEMQPQTRKNQAILESDLEVADTVKLVPNIESPKILIRTELKDNDTAMICIADNGHGIPQDLISQVFNPFFTTKPVGQGTGLGLSISYQIIAEKHKGSLRCVSEPNRGTEFWIEIPVR